MYAAQGLQPETQSPAWTAVMEHADEQQARGQQAHVLL